MVYLGDGLILVITILLFQEIPISSHSKRLLLFLNQLYLGRILQSWESRYQQHCFTIANFRQLSPIYLFHVTSFRGVKWVWFKKLHSICMKSSVTFSPLSNLYSFQAEDSADVWLSRVSSKVTSCNQITGPTAVVRPCSARHNPSEEGPFPWIFKQLLVLHPLGSPGRVGIQSSSRMNSNGLLFGKDPWKQFGKISVFIAIISLPPRDRNGVWNHWAYTNSHEDTIETEATNR